MGNCGFRDRVSPGGRGSGASASDPLLVVPELGDGARLGGDRPVLRGRPLPSSLGSGVGPARGRGGRRPRATGPAGRLARSRLAARSGGAAGGPLELASPSRPRTDPVGKPTHRAGPG